MTRNERAIEEFVERELARASEVEPVAGLEDRLIARLRSAEPSARRGVAPSWWWAAGSVLATAAAILLAVFVGRPPTSSTSPAAPRSASVSTPSPSLRETVRPREHARPSRGESTPVPSGPRETARTRQPRPRVTAPRTPPLDAPPRLAVFPTPRPLSRQEQLLLVLASRPEEAAGFVEEQQRPITPLEIREIVIAPLETRATSEDQNSELRIRELMADR